MLINKAVVPVLSGTEMFPIADKPLLEYAVLEVIQAGITHVIFVSDVNTQANVDFFIANNCSRIIAGENENDEELSIKISSPIQFSHLHEKDVFSLAHAMLLAEKKIANEAFALVLAQDLISNRLPCLAVMLSHFTKNNCSLLAVQAVPWNDINQYDVVTLNDSLEQFSRIKTILNKPSYKESPSNLACLGRYIFTAKIFKYLQNSQTNTQAANDFTETIRQFVKEEPAFAFQFNGKYYNCNSTLGYLQASVDYALIHPEVGEIFKDYLLEILSAEYSFRGENLGEF